MARQPARLADFEIPRGEGAVPDVQATQHPAPADEAGGAAVQVVAASDQPAPQAQAADAVPLRIAPRPPAEARQAMTIRLPVSTHERIRLLMFVSRRSQQDIVEDALNAFLTANQV
jgi:hypothetical protein